LQLPVSEFFHGQIDLVACFLDHLGLVLEISPLSDRWAACILHVLQALLHSFFEDFLVPDESFGEFVLLFQPFS
jgi:hypothetical protein